MGLQSGGDAFVFLIMKLMGDSDFFQKKSSIFVGVSCRVSGVGRSLSSRSRGLVNSDERMHAYGSWRGATRRVS